MSRHFLSWDQPLLGQAVTWLARGWTGAGPLDLSRVLVVVPTRQSGRRLREALAEHAAARGQAAFPPRVLPPDALISLDLPADTATPIEALLAWVDVLLTADFAALRAVFPVDPPARNFSWALALARTLVRLQAALTEGGLTMADVATRAGDGFPETARWEQLGQLEAEHAARLASAGRRDVHAARIAAARAKTADEGLERVVLLGAPDPLPLALTRLETLARTIPVDVVVFAPESEQVAFDAWGRPVPEAWAGRTLAMEDFAAHVHLCADGGAQAEHLAALARGYAAPEGWLGLGFADTELVPVTENALRRAGRAAFDPAGRPRRLGALFQLLSALAALRREASWTAVATLARCPDFLSFLHARIGGSFSSAYWLAELDELRARHLPANLAMAQRHAAGSSRFKHAERGLAAMAELREALGTRAFADGALAALEKIFGQRRLDLSRPEDAAFEENAAAWMEVVRDCAAAERAFGALTAEAGWELALQRFGESVAAEEKPAGALELQGWLELLWEDAPHLAIAGFNDGRVPDAVAGDVFLPENLRARLGLKTNAARFARDAYLLQALVASRAQAGRVDLLFGKTSAEGDPLRPSRLLLQCADAELPARIAQLFRDPPGAAAQPAWRRAWQLRPRRIEPPARLAVTALRSYLECPFRFYLRHGLKMAPVDPGKSELDALDFGTLCHAALERLGDPEWRDCTDAGALRAMLVGEFDAAVRARYGEHVALPLIVQLESARQRLGRAAEVQAEERAAGWAIEYVERKFEVEIGGVTISGKIDRIDRHVVTGARRVLDYKTSDAAAAPEAKHLGPVRREGAYAEWALFAPAGGRPRAWADLQLPVYLHALPQLGLEIGIGETAAGYFNLPKAVSETRVSLWTDYARETHEAALACVRGVIAAVRAGQFWPPNEGVKADWDDYAALFQRGVAASVAWEDES